MSPPTDLRSLLRDHVGLIIAAFIAASVAGKILLVSRGDPAIALTILSAAPLQTAVFGSALTVGPVAAGVITALLVVTAVRLAYARQPIWPVLAGVSLVLLVGFFAVPLVPAVVYLVGVVVVTALLVAVASDRTVAQVPALPTISAAIIVAIAMAPVMWLPAEDVRSSTETVTGYVLASDNAWTTVLTEDPVIRRWKTAEVLSRRVCRTRDDYWLTAAQLVFGWRSATPICASTSAQ